MRTGPSNMKKKKLFLITLYKIDLHCKILKTIDILHIPKFMMEAAELLSNSFQKNGDL